MTGHIPREFITDVLTRVDIVSLIDARVPLKKAGSNYQACCPFHSEKTPSFIVSPHKQFYHCFGCGVSGNAIGFLMAYDRLDFVSAVELLAQQLGIEVPYTQQTISPVQQQKQLDLYSVLEKASEYYQLQLRHSEVAINYLKKRGMTGAIAKQYSIGYAPAGWDNLLRQINQPELLINAGLILKKEEGSGYYDRFRERIIFPIHDRRGRVIAFGGRVLDNSLPKYLNSPETTLFHKSNVLYGLYEARQANADLDSIIVVEGYMDVVALAQAGFTNAVATLGTATTPQHMQLLLQQTSKIIFCFDGDRAGKTAAWRALESTLSVLQDGAQIKFLFLPEGEDPDSLVRKESATTFTERLNQAINLADYFFAHLKSQVNLNTMEGRARFINLALPLIESIAAPFMKEMMIDRLAEWSRMDKQRLMSFNQQELTKNHEQIAMALKQKTPMRLIIALLLQYPQLARNMTIDISKLTLPGGELLQKIVQLLQKQPHLNTASILEYWRDQPELNQLNKLAVWDLIVPELGIVAEWEGALRHLQQLQIENNIEILLDKANTDGLSQEEKLVLQNLLTERGSV